MTDLLAAIGWLDLTSITVLLVFTVLGLFRGLVWQATRLGALVLGYVVASRYTAALAGHVQTWLRLEEGPVPIYITYVALFVGVLVVCALLGLLLRRLLRRTGLSPVDRVAGGAVGLLTGAALLLAALTVLLAVVPEGGLARDVRASQSAAAASHVVEVLDRFFPEAIRDLFRGWKEEEMEEREEREQTDLQEGPGEGSQEPPPTGR